MDRKYYFYENKNCFYLYCFYLININKFKKLEILVLVFWGSVGGVKGRGGGDIFNNFYLYVNK